MVLQNYFADFELNQSLCWAKSKDPYGKKNTPDHLHLSYIYKSNISGLSPLRLLTMILKSPQFKSKVVIFIPEV